MILKERNYFILTSEKSSYVMRVLETGELENVYYGKRIDDFLGIEYLSDSFDVNIGNRVYIDEEHQHYFPSLIRYEYPSSGSGDNREGAIDIRYQNGLTALSPVFKSYRIYKGKNNLFPSHALSGSETETLEITLKDKVLDIYIILNYTIYPSSDIILRSAVIENRTNFSITLERISSLSIDFPYSDFILYSYDGAWARERGENKRKLKEGITIIDSKLGSSSNEHSPLVFLEREETGEVYGFNLIYSGNHRECIEVSPYGKTRITTGINDYAFSWTLKEGERFSTPEAIVTYAEEIDDASCNFHTFINEYIVRGVWKNKERPILINSWEASYFNYTEESLLKLAKTASELGFELFVLDDGWFSARRSDTSSLGDWTVSLDIFPHGLSAFSEKIKALGLSFGIWVEPEMVNEDSDLYRAHPEWVIKVPGRDALICRHQLVLDLSREDVRDYLYNALEAVFSEGNVSYVKWDMNRTITDYYSQNKECRSSLELSHRYIIGLYDLLERITKRFPNILFEGCAAGGNRYDLGMLCYMSQIWTSDNTDLYHRLRIQEGTLRGFPPSTMGAHVSASPAHQSLRRSLIDSRFDVAAFGVLGYELDLNKLSEKEKRSVKDQIEFYKKYRKVFQYGRFRVLKSSAQNYLLWSIQYEKTTIAMQYVFRNMPNWGRSDRIRVPFLDKKKHYRVRNRVITIEKENLGDLYKDYKKEESEMDDFIVSGEILISGIALSPQFHGNGFFPSTRVIGDNGTRMYIIEEL